MAKASRRPVRQSMFTADQILEDVSTIKKAKKKKTEVTFTSSTIDTHQDSTVLSDGISNVPPPDLAIMIPQAHIAMQRMAEIYAAKTKTRRLISPASRRLLMLGLQIPMAMRLLLRITAIPLGGTTIQLVGKEGSGKTSLTLEIMRWIARQGGYGVVNLAETKWSPDLAPNILQEFEDNVTTDTSDSQDGWMIALQAQREAYLKAGDDRRILGLAVDSVSGKISEKVMTTIASEGVPGQRYATEAKSNTDFFRAYTGQVSRCPSLIVLVNHLKESMAQNKMPGSKPERSVPGGALLKFQESLELEIRKGGSVKIFKDKYDIDEGHSLTISVIKSSLAADKGVLRVKKTWRNNNREEGAAFTEKSRGLVKFEWADALTTYLFDTNYGAAATYAKEIKEILGYRILAGKPKALISSRLGFGENNALPWAESYPASPILLGQAIEANAEVCKDLYQLFGVSVVAPFEPQIGWKKQMERQMKKVEERESNLRERSEQTLKDLKKKAQTAKKKLGVVAKGPKKAETKPMVTKASAPRPVSEIQDSSSKVVKIFKPAPAGIRRRK